MCMQAGMKRERLSQMLVMSATRDSELQSMPSSRHIPVYRLFVVEAGEKAPHGLASARQHESKWT